MEEEDETKGYLLLEILTEQIQGGKWKVFVFGLIDNWHPLDPLCKRFGDMIVPIVNQEDEVIQ